MNRRRGIVGMVLAIAALGCAAVVAAGGGVWVSSDGETHGIHNGGRVVLVGGGDGFDLSQLAEGETRVFGSGEGAVTVTRRADVATITRAAAGDSQAVDLRCDLGRDKCRIVTSDTEPERVMIVVQKERTCVDGEGDCAEVSLDGIDALPGDGRQITINKVVSCDNPHECKDAEALSDRMMRIHVDGELSPDHFVFTTADGAAHPEIVVMPRGDSVLLRCPEGDATLRVTKEEARDVYLCPKHAQPMQKIEPRSGVKQRDSSQPRSH